ncbi:MAG: ABC-2 family transporter protein [Lachnospiraceae bacterium]|nr:ABC-2 family transporter protein [Lachnospiraceae bacterium]MDY5741711.1 ABC-2 family transporter protein [Lachnospiraceae bacterium]
MKKRMRSIRRYGRLYRISIAAFFQKLMQSRVDFLLGLIGFFLTQLMGILFIYLVFRQIPDLYGWSMEDLIFIYGFAQLPRGLDHLLTDNLWLLAWRWVRTGDFDRYLLRPVNILFQIISETIQPDAIGELLLGIVITVRAVRLGVLNLGGIKVFWLFASVLAGSLIYTGIKLLFSALAFWLKTSGPILQLAYEVADFAKYPTQIYSRLVRVIITWVLPFAFVAFLPAAFLLERQVPILGHDVGAGIIGLEWLLALGICLTGYAVFQRGIGRYESAGN